MFTELEADNLKKIHDHVKSPLYLMWRDNELIGVRLSQPEPGDYTVAELA